MVHLSTTLVMIMLALFTASPVLGFVRLPGMQVDCHYGYCLRREYVEARRQTPTRSRRRSLSAMESRDSWETFHTRRNVLESRDLSELEARSPIVILPGQPYHYREPPVFNGHYLKILRELQPRTRNDRPLDYRERIARRKAD